MGLVTDGRCRCNAAQGFSAGHQRVTFSRTGGVQFSPKRRVVPRVHVRPHGF